MRLLSKPEELILLAVWKLGNNAYGVTIRNHIIHQTGMDWTVGAVYVPLARLTKQGYLETTLGEPTTERGGKRKKFYRLSKDGFKILSHMRRINQSMWFALPDPEEEIQ